jgi:hypothetical protein
MKDRNLTTICDNIDEPVGIMLNEISQTQKDKYCISYLHMEF